MKKGSQTDRLKIRELELSHEQEMNTLQSTWVTLEEQIREWLYMMITLLTKRYRILHRPADVGNEDAVNRSSCNNCILLSQM